MIELHRELSAPLRSGTQLGGVTEHFGKGNFRVDDLRAVSVVGAEDGAATAADVAHQIAEIIFGSDDLHFHNRFEKHGMRLFNAVLERHGTGNLERHFGRVHFVIRTVVHDNLVTLTSTTG